MSFEAYARSLISKVMDTASMVAELNQQKQEQKVVKKEPPPVLKQFQRNIVDIPAPSVRLSRIKKEICAPVINVDNIRKISYYGIPDRDNTRAVVWKMLLGLLPSNPDEWDNAIALRREQYWTFCEDLILDATKLSQAELGLPDADAAREDNPEPIPNLDQNSNSRVNLTPSLPTVALFPALPKPPQPELIGSTTTSRSTTLPFSSSSSSSSPPAPPAFDIPLDPLCQLFDPVDASSSSATPLSAAADGDGSAPFRELRGIDVSDRDHPLSLQQGSRWNEFFRDSEIRIQIERDVRRTHPQIAFFSGEGCEAEANRQSLERALFMFAKLNPGLRYVQGMNELIAPLLFLFAHERPSDAAHPSHWRAAKVMSRTSAGQQPMTAAMTAVATTVDVLNSRPVDSDQRTATATPAVQSCGATSDPLSSSTSTGTVSATTTMTASATTTAVVVNGGLVRVSTSNSTTSAFSVSQKTRLEEDQNPLVDKLKESSSSSSLETAPKSTDPLSSSDPSTTRSIATDTAAPAAAAQVGLGISKIQIRLEDSPLGFLDPVPPRSDPNPNAPSASQSAAPRAASSTASSSSLPCAPMPRVVTREVSGGWTLADPVNSTEISSSSSNSGSSSNAAATPSPFANGTIVTSAESLRNEGPFFPNVASTSASHNNHSNNSTTTGSGSNSSTLTMAPSKLSLGSSASSSSTLFPSLMTSSSSSSTAQSYPALLLQGTSSSLSSSSSSIIHPSASNNSFNASSSPFPNSSSPGMPAAPPATWTLSPLAKTAALAVAGGPSGPCFLWIPDDEDESTPSSSLFLPTAAAPGTINPGILSPSVPPASSSSPCQLQQPHPAALASVGGVTAHNGPTALAFSSSPPPISSSQRKPSVEEGPSSQQSTTLSPPLPAVATAALTATETATMIRSAVQPPQRKVQQEQEPPSLSFSSSPSSSPVAAAASSTPLTAPASSSSPSSSSSSCLPAADSACPSSSTSSSVPPPTPSTSTAAPQSVSAAAPAATATTALRLQPTAEADAFWCFVDIMSVFRDQFCPHLDNASTGVRATIRRLMSYLRRVDPDLWRHIEETNRVDPQFFAFRWITLLLSQEFPLPAVFVLWDAIFSDPRGRMDTLLRVCVAMMLHARDALLAADDFAMVLRMLQRYPMTAPRDVDTIVRLAAALPAVEVVIREKV